MIVVILIIITQSYLFVCFNEKLIHRQNFSHESTISQNDTFWFSSSSTSVHNWGNISFPFLRKFMIQTSLHRVTQRVSEGSNNELSGCIILHIAFTIWTNSSHEKQATPCSSASLLCVLEMFPKLTIAS